jgi:hypothetical protein
VRWTPCSRTGILPVPECMATLTGPARCRSYSSDPACCRDPTQGLASAKRKSEQRTQGRTRPYTTNPFRSTLLDDFSACYATPAVRYLIHGLFILLLKAPGRLFSSKKTLSVKVLEYASCPRVRLIRSLASSSLLRKHMRVFE